MIREKVKRLWKLCFNDSEEFIEMYFRLRYNSKVNIVIESGEEVIAALQMLPYPMTFGGNTVQTAYMSGICTHPDYRGRGVMRELFSQALGRMYHDDVVFSTLIPAEPWLFDYYATMGYATVFYYSKHRFRLPDKKQNATSNTNWTFRILTEYDEEVYQFLNRKLNERPCCLQHTSSDFETVLADLRLSEGAVYVLSDESSVLGVAIAYPDAESAVPRIEELATDSAEAEQYLLTCICREAKTDALEISIPPTEGEEKPIPIGMARIICPKIVLQLYAVAHPKTEINIALIDEHVSANNGYYYLNNGKCMFSRKRLPGTHTLLNMEQLTKMVFADEQAYMSLMLN